MLRRMFGGAAAMAAACVATVLLAAPALAGLGQPTDGQLGLQLPGSGSMEELSALYDIVNYVIIAIALFVLLLMVYVMFRFSERNNPTPSRTTHNTALEVAWTIIPILVLVGISIPSFHLLYTQYSFPKPDLTVKAIGSAWSWDHEYLDQQFTVSSNMIGDEEVLKEKLGEDAFAEKYGALEGAARHAALYDDAKPVWTERNELRRLTVDNDIVLPVNKVVHLLVTSTDVIHQWTVPSFGVKMQAVPGRTSAVWFQPNKTGTFHGQCSVLCGKFHSAMPITVRVVEQPIYDGWVAALKAKDRKKAKEILNSDAVGAGARQAVAQAPST